MSNSDTVIQQLSNQLEQDPLLAALLPLSLTVAAQQAKNQLDPALFQALSWPTSNDAYLAYLTEFSTLIPQENTNSDITTWNNPETGYSQEVYDRLCQFYWLIDQGVSHLGKQYTLQSYVSPVNQFSFGAWLVDFANAWGSFLDTPPSLTAETL